MSRTDLASRVRAAVRDVPYFPQPGIIFKDITPVLADAALFSDVVTHFAEHLLKHHIDVVAGIESRGFIFGAPLATQLNTGFVPIRKPGKLPHDTHRFDYDLEYGSDALEMHVDAIHSGSRVLLIDDLLATGGTIEACLKLAERCRATVVGC